MAGGSRKRLRDVLQERQGEIMGRGTSKVSGDSRIAKVRQLQKDLTKAKAAETKAKKNYMSAEGAVVAFDWNALTEHYGRKTAETKYKEKRKQASLAQKKYNDAIKREIPYRER